MMVSGQKKEEKMYSGTIDCATKMLKTEGITGNPTPYRRILQGQLEQRLEEHR